MLSAVFGFWDYLVNKVVNKCNLIKNITQSGEKK